RRPGHRAPFPHVSSTETKVPQRPDDSAIQRVGLDHALEAKAGEEPDPRLGPNLRLAPGRLAERLDHALARVALDHRGNRRRVDAVNAATDRVEGDPLV